MTKFTSQKIDFLSKLTMKKLKIISTLFRPVFCHFQPKLGALRPPKLLSLNFSQPIFWDIFPNFRPPGNSEIGLYREGGKEKERVWKKKKEEAALRHQPMRMEDWQSPDPFLRLPLVGTQPLPPPQHRPVLLLLLPVYHYDSVWEWLSLRRS